MASPLRPKTEDEAPATPGQDGGILKWFDDPANRSALIGFGAQMLQPIGPGQTNLGHFGEALSTGGEAARGVQKQELAQQEADSREQLRGAQAGAAEARASAAGVNAARQGDRLTYLRENMEARDFNTKLSNFMRQQALVQKQNAEIEKRNKERDLGLRTDVKEPQLPQASWEDALTASGAGRGQSQPVTPPTAPAGPRPLTPQEIETIKGTVSREPARAGAIRSEIDRIYGPGTADKILGR